MNNQFIISNEYNYSSVIPSVDYINYLVQYMESEYKKLDELIKEDEEKNKQFKEEYKEYKYKDSYSHKFDIYVSEKSYNSIHCANYEQFQKLNRDGQLKQVNYISLELDLDYRRGNNNNYEKYENSFSVVFKPYNIIFARKSNSDDESMNNIEKNIKSILDQFPKVNTIFYTE